MNDNNANLILERMNNNSLSFEFVNSILKKYPDSYNQFMSYTNILALSRIKNNIKKISNNELNLEELIKQLNNIYFDCKNIIFNDLFYGFALNDESRDFMNKLGMYDSLEYYKNAYSYIIKKYNELDESEKENINIDELKSPSELIKEVNSMISEKTVEYFLGTIEEQEKDTKRLAYATKLMSKEEVHSLYQTLKKYHNGKPKIVLDVFSNALRERFGPLTDRELEEYLGRGETYQEKTAGSRFDEYLKIPRDISRKLQELQAMFPDMEDSLKDNKTPTAKK